jgi:allantoicase
VWDSLLNNGEKNSGDTENITVGYRTNCIGSSLAFSFSRAFSGVLALNDPIRISTRSTLAHKTRGQNNPIFELALYFANPLGDIFSERCLLSASTFVLNTDIGVPSNYTYIMSTTMESDKTMLGQHHYPSVTGVAELTEVPMPAKNVAPPSPFAANHLNLASGDAGARILFATDEWFAAADNLLKDSPPHFDCDAYCEQGKVMDGWESRRRREAGHDWCVAKLASRGIVQAIEIDTANFTGNNVPHISIEIADLNCPEETHMVIHFPGVLDRLLHGCVQGTGASPQEVHQAEEACQRVSWNNLLAKTPLSPGYEASRMHYISLNNAMEGTHVRVNYYPDGGVARLRLWGQPTVPYRPSPRPAYVPIKTGRTCSVVSHSEADLPSRQPYVYPELSGQEYGGVGFSCTNKHYGDPWNLIQPTLGRDMGDGWETARHPSRPSILQRDPITNLVDSPLMDYCIIKLGDVAGDGIARIILDTKHFRGNYPESVQVQGCHASDDQVTAGEVEWFPLLGRGRMAPDSEHVYDRDAGHIENAHCAVSHVKVSIYPDGGLSRVRVYGAPGDLQ